MWDDNAWGRCCCCNKRRRRRIIRIGNLITLFRLGVMRPTNSSCNTLVGTSLMAASFHPCAMHDTNSSFPGLVGTSLMAASFLSCVVRDTDPSVCNSICTRLMAASFLRHLCSMRPTYTSLNDKVGTSLLAAHPVCVLSWLGWDIPAWLQPSCRSYTPSWLHLFLFAPWVMHTPPLIACLVHISKCQRLCSFVAP